MYLWGKIKKHPKKRNYGTVFSDNVHRWNAYRSPSKYLNYLLSHPYSPQKVLSAQLLPTSNFDNANILCYRFRPDATRARNQQEFPRMAYADNNHYIPIGWYSLG